MSRLAKMADSLFNALSGMGGKSDPRSATVYGFLALSPGEIVNAYRSSALMRKVVRIPAQDSVSAWRNWQAEKDQITALEEAERKLGIQAKVLQAEVYRGLGGGALILGLPGDPAMPANAKQIGAGGLAFVQVVSRFKLSGNEWIDDPTQEGFGGPDYWNLNTTRGAIRLHPSRVIPFPGEPLPDVTGIGAEDAFWGDSKVQIVLDAVQDADTARQAFASLIHKSRLTKLGIPDLLNTLATTEGEDAFKRRMQSFMMAEGLFSALVYDAGMNGEDGESIEHDQFTWTGIPEIIRVFAETVSAISDIPMTRLWGRAPEGMNSSGDSQQKDWNKTVTAKQMLEVRPCLDQLDQFLIPSALGSRPPDVWWEFCPLESPSEKDEADRFKTTMDAIEKVQATAAIPEEAFNKAFQNTMTENGWMPGLEGALLDIPEAERYGLQMQVDPTQPDPSALQMPVDPTQNPPAAN